MKSDQEVRSYIIGAMRQFGNQPSAFLNVVCGYVTSLQDLMKRDHEDLIADRICEHRHPGVGAQGLYCKMCHEVEMTGQFASLPPEAGGVGHVAGTGLQFPGEEPGLGGGDDESMLLMGANIKPPDK